MWKTLEQELDGAARHAHHRRPDGGRDRGGAPAPARQARDRGGGGARRAACSRERSCGRSRRTSPTISSAPPSAPRRGTPTRRSPHRSSRSAPPRQAPSIRTHAEVTGRRRSSRTAARHASPSRPSAGRIRAHRLVNAAGAWANELAALTGLELPHPVGRAASERDRAARARARADGAAHRPPADAEADGRTTRSSSAAAGRRDPSRGRSRYSTRWESMAGNVAVAVRVVPLLADVRIVRTWSGVMAFTDDLAPIVGRVAAAARLPHADRDDRLHPEPADGAAAGGDDGDGAKRDPARVRRRPRRRPTDPDLRRQR